MRRVCTTAVLVGSLLVSAAPAHANLTVNHRHMARAGAKQAHISKQRAERGSTREIMHTYTYGRT
jgi:hypothetical protein